MDPAGTIPTVLTRLGFQHDALTATYVPRVADANTQLVFDLYNARAPKANPPTRFPEIDFSRWMCALPADDVLQRNACPVISTIPCAFAYTTSDATVDWYMNFADAELFEQYGSAYMGADEQQVAEHPALASIRGALVAALPRALRTVEVVGGVPLPTPCLITNVPRRLTLTMPCGHGSRFSRVERGAVARAVRVLDPPTFSNILAIKMPDASCGVYRTETLWYILQAAYTGFRAAVIKSASHFPGKCVVVHTGAGVGSADVMSCLQFLAARAAGVSGVVFHTISAAQREAAHRSLAIVQGLGDPTHTVASVMQAVDDAHFVWD
jgi:hypothetical protein